MSTTVTRPVTTPPTAAETALAYVREVRNRFERQPRTYEEFLNVMKDFKSGVCVLAVHLERRASRRRRRRRGGSAEWTRETTRETTRGLTNAARVFDRRRLTADNVVTRVRRVFKGHADLLDGFRAFLPEVRRDVGEMKCARFGTTRDDDDGDRSIDRYAPRADDIAREMRFRRRRYSHRRTNERTNERTNGSFSHPALERRVNRKQTAESDRPTDRTTDASFDASNRTFATSSNRRPIAVAVARRPAVGAVTSRADRVADDPGRGGRPRPTRVLTTPERTRRRWCVFFYFTSSSSLCDLSVREPSVGSITRGRPSVQKSTRRAALRVGGFGFFLTRASSRRAHRGRLRGIPIRRRLVIGRFRESSARVGVQKSPLRTNVRR